MAGGGKNTQLALPVCKASEGTEMEVICSTVRRRGPQCTIFAVLEVKKGKFDSWLEGFLGMHPV
jgi:hypothetical protein